ncbi:MAG: flagellar basal body rod protein FlgB [Armatimonadota bacterium]|nr:flagellar basal body rod protein FlgB [Armatimonadota bacterium]
MADGVSLDLTTRLLHAALSCTAAQQRLAANNLANVETPGYVAHRASFQDRLQAALDAERRGRSEGALQGVRPDVTPAPEPPGPDGNNVNLEAEMVGLAEATTRYEVLSRMLDRKLEMIGVAIGDGRQG